MASILNDDHFSYTYEVVAVPTVARNYSIAIRRLGAVLYPGEGPSKSVEFPAESHIWTRLFEGFRSLLDREWPEHPVGVGGTRVSLEFLPNNEQIPRQAPEAVDAVSFRKELYQAIEDLVAPVKALFPNLAQ